MVSSKGHLAVPFLIAAAVAAQAQDDGLNDLLMTGVEMTTTSGTLVVQRVDAERAIVSPDGRQVITERLDLMTLMEGGGTINASAPQGAIIVGGDRRYPSPDDEAPTFELLREYGDNFGGRAWKGDILLKGTAAGDVRAEIDNRIEVLGSALVWSAAYGLFVLPYPFRQEARPESGEVIVIRGGALFSDENFRTWTYFSDTEAPIIVEYENPGNNS